MKPTQPDWKEKLAKKYKTKGYQSDYWLNEHSYFTLEKFIESILLSQQAQYRAELEKERESKDGAYRERNLLVQALTKLFPSYLARHDENDMGWDRDWMWIVYIDLPTGQVSWHLHDSEVQLFSHLEVQENKWDGHNTERKYERLQALALLTQ